MSRTQTPSRSTRKGGSRRGVMNFQDAVAFLAGSTNFERLRPTRVPRDEFKLDRVRAILELLNDPQRDLRCIHVAGSKGKGSTCEMLASALQACGYTVGLYTSPHLVDVRERVRINGVMIAEEDFAALMNRVREAAEAVAPLHGSATYFELMTALGLTHFAEQAVDVAVIEVGLGGRLDCTNVVKPEVCAITEIQREHAAILGDTVELIAREKAGIMKPGAPCITVPQSPEVLAVLRAEAERVGTTLSVLGEDIEYSMRFEAGHAMGPHARVSVSGTSVTYEHLAVPLPGERQAPNCGLALAVLDRLTGRGFACPERLVSEGLERTPRHGRMELALASPRVYLDGAHNPESIESLVRAIGATVKYDSMVMVFGAAADKEIDGMLEWVARGADKVIFTRATNNPRAADPADLLKRFAKLSPKMAQTKPNVREAINTAARAIGREDIIVVCGSFHLAGEAKALITEKLARTTTAS